MQKPGLRIWLPLALLLSCNGAQARDVNGHYAVFGVGHGSCADYLNARDRGGADETRYIDWVAGHVSAYNLLLVNTYDMLGELTPFTLFAQLDTHCRRHREQAFVQALAEQMENLYERRANLAPHHSGWKDWLNEIRKGPEAPPSTPDNSETP